MFSYLFNRERLTWRVVEVAGLLLIVTGVGSASTISRICCGILLMAHLFLRGCASHRWYPGRERYAGIQLHLWKAVIASSYILMISLLLARLVGAPALICGIFLEGILVQSNCSLIFFHLRDHDPTPVNFYSGGHFLRDGKVSPSPSFDAISTRHFHEKIL